MDSEAYLNRISAQARRIKNGNGGLLNSTLFKVLAGVVIGLTVFMIMAGILGSGESVKDKLSALKVHTTNLSELITTYQPYLKSTALRSNSASLNSVLTNTNNGLGTYLLEKYKVEDDKGLSKSLAQKEADQKEKLEEDLFSARINGLINRTFASKMAYEITIITTREREIIKLTNKEDLKNILETSLNSLDNLYNNFNNYSEAR